MLSSPGLRGHELLGFVQAGRWSCPPTHSLPAHARLLQRLPEITVYRQSPWQSDRRQKIASVPYAHPTTPT